MGRGGATNCRWKVTYVNYESVITISLKPSREWPKSASAVAKALGCSRAAVVSWLARGAPGKTRRGYDLEAIRSWRETNLEPARRTKFSEAYGEDIARLKKAQADLAELKFQIQRGDFVLRSEVLASNYEKFHAIKTAFLALPRSVAPALVSIEEPGKIEEILGIRVRSILERLCSLKKGETP